MSLWDGYHWDGFDWVEIGRKDRAEINNLPGWTLVVLPNGEVWLKTPKTSWEKIRDVQENE